MCVCFQGLVAGAAAAAAGTTAGTTAGTLLAMSLAEAACVESERKGPYIYSKNTRIARANTTNGQRGVLCGTVPKG